MPDCLPVAVRRLALLDIEKAAAWYEDRVTGLGKQFVDEIDLCFESIASTPERFPVVYRDVRRALVRKFPYAVFFVARVEEIAVIACVHTRRNPKRWHGRR